MCCVLFALCLPRLHTHPTQPTQVIQLCGEGKRVLLPVLPPEMDECRLCGSGFDPHVECQTNLDSLVLPEVFTPTGSADGVLCYRQCKSSFCRARYFATYVQPVPSSKAKYVYSDFTSQSYMVSTTLTVYSMEFMRHYDASLLTLSAPYSGFEKFFNEMYKYRYVVCPHLIHQHPLIRSNTTPLSHRNLDMWTASLSDIKDRALPPASHCRKLDRRSVADTVARYSALKMLMLDPAGEVLLGPYPTARAAASRGHRRAIKEIFDARHLFCPSECTPPLHAFVSAPNAYHTHTPYRHIGYRVPGGQRQPSYAADPLPSVGRTLLSWP